MINNGKPLSFQHLTYPHAPQQTDKLSRYLRTLHLPTACRHLCLPRPHQREHHPHLLKFLEKNVHQGSCVGSSVTDWPGEAPFPSFCAVLTHLFLGSHLFCPTYLISPILRLDNTLPSSSTSWSTSTNVHNDAAKYKSLQAKDLYNKFKDSTQETI